MSPEQVAGESGLDVRADVYSLGVLLYEVLTGQSPIDLAGCGLPEAMRRITHEEPRPLQEHSTEFRGDVSVIVSKALHKDKGRRYQSASALAEDLRRYLSGAPVRARSDSTWYVVRRVLFQHRATALAALSFLVLGVAFAVVTGLQSASNRRLATSEHAARVRAERQLAFSNIERGRLFAENHNGLGEELIWREFLRDPESRHAYWALWELYSHNPCVATQLGHGERARQAEVSPTGQWFATGDIGGAVVIWDAGARKLHDVPKGSAAVRGMSAAPDGGSLAVSYIDGTVILWDVRARSRLWSVTLPGVDAGGTVQASGARNLIHHPTMDLLVSTGSSENVEILRASTGEHLRTVEHDERVWSVALAPDGRRLAAMGSPEVRVWELPAYDLIAAFTGHDRLTFSGAFNSDGSELVTGGVDRQLIAWDLASGEPRRTVTPGNGWLRRLTPRSDGGGMFANGLYRADVVELADLTSGQSVPFFDSATAGFAAFPDDSLVVTAADSGIIRLWELGAPPGRQGFRGHTGPARASMSADGRYLASGDASGDIRLWTVSSGELLRTVSTGAGQVRSIRFRPGKPQVVANDPAGGLHLVDLESGEVRSLGEGCSNDSHRAVEFSPDGGSIAAACRDHTFRMWRVSDGLLEREFSVAPYEALSVAISRDGRRVATVSRREPTRPAEPWTHRIDVWTMDGVHLASEESGAPWWSIGFSPDGSTLVSGTWDWKVGLWAWEDDSLDLLEGHEGIVWDVQYLPEPIDLVASSSGDGTVRLWDPVERRNVLRLRAFERDDAISLDHSADGTFLSVAGESEEAMVWDLTHFDRHIAGNLEAALADLGADLGSEDRSAEVEGWAARALARPWPRLRR